MASPARELNLTEAEDVEVWLLEFEAKLRTKMKKLKAEDADSFATDLFISTCGKTALKKLRAVVSPKVISQLNFADIKAAIIFNWPSGL